MILRLLYLSKIASTISGLVMKNILHIKNFLVFKEATIDIHPWTILIGPQASGKSIIAKLIYIFNHIPQFYYESILNDNRKRFLVSKIIENFKEIFPESSWRGKSFELTLETRHGELSLTYKSGNSMTLTMSEYYEKKLADLYAQYRRFKEKNIEKDIEKDDVLFKGVSNHQLPPPIFLRECMSKLDFGFINNTSSPIFIPAGRSFFACIEKNVFGFLANNISIDYFLKNFGDSYEQAKNLYEFYLSRKRKKNIDFDRICTSALKGIYYIDSKNKKELIRSVTSGTEVEIKNSSSGQQEILPALLVLSFLSRKRRFILFEEPEAHIFPSTQYEVVKFLSSSMNINNQGAYCITTHSPYILSSLNNLLYAGLVCEKYKDNAEKIEALNKIIPANEYIAPDTLIAYYIEDGEISLIMDKETGLIDGNAIDSISEITSSEFDRIQDLEY